MYSVVRDSKEERHQARNGQERLQRKGQLSQGNSMNELGKGYGLILPVFWMSKSTVLKGTGVSSDSSIDGVLPYGLGIHLHPFPELPFSSG